MLDPCMINSCIHMHSSITFFVFLYVIHNSAYLHNSQSCRFAHSHAAEMSTNSDKHVYSTASTAESKLCRKNANTEINMDQSIKNQEILT